MTRIFGLFVMLMTVTVTLNAEARTRSVFLNGVDISDVRGQEFKKATVRLDEKGNVHIDAPGYKVQVVEPGTGSTSTAATNDNGGKNLSLSKRYYLVTQPSVGGVAQYRFLVSINGHVRKDIQAGSDQVIMEISAWLHLGENEIVIKAMKNLGEGRKSSSPKDVAKVIIGVGHEDGKVVKIDSIKGSVKANASELSTKEKHIVLIAE
jgi:hypothetical protein